MAIGQGSKVGIKTAATGLSLGSITPQPPLFGIVTSVSEGSFTVLWDNGILVDNLTSDSVDEILDAGNDGKKFFGKTVAVTGYASSYNSVVVDAYQRDTDVVVLLKTLANGTFLEVLASSVVVVPGA